MPKKPKPIDPEPPIDTPPPDEGDLSILPPPVIKEPPTIAQLQAAELETLQALKQSQTEARQANAISHHSGNESPVKISEVAQNHCPKCGNQYLAVYETIKMCNPCGWRSDQHEMEPYE